jgi:uncharacterized damage-inducible protein DinB
MWTRVQEEFIEIVDLVPEGKLDWSPAPGQWNFKGILLHIVFGRHGMMTRLIDDGEAGPPDMLAAGQTAGGLKEQLRLSWERMTPFRSDPAQLSRTFEIGFEGRQVTLTGDWLAFGQLEHDIHHRAGLYSYLDQLGVAHPEPDTIIWKLTNG